MSTKSTEQQQTYLAPHERAEARKAATAKVNEGIELRKRGALTIGQGLWMGRPTFAADDDEGFQKWACKVTNGAWETCRSYMAVAKAHKGFRSKRDQAKVEALTVEQGQVLASVPEEDRKVWLSKVQATTTPTEARQIRDDIADAKLSPEDLKAKQDAKVAREKKRAAEKTSALQESIRDTVLAYLEKGDVGRAMVAGAVLAEQHKGEKVSDAIGAILAKRAKAQKVLAEQEKKHQRELAAAARKSS